MSFPVHDWQFWVVTALFILALLWIGRGVLPLANRRRNHRRKRAALTVGGRPIAKE